MQQQRTVIGIDPGTHRVGYAVVVETDKGWHALDSGVFQFPRSLAIPQRLNRLYDEVSALLSEHTAHCLVVEEPHIRPFGMRSALIVAQSVGIIKLAAIKAGVPVFSYPYTQAKRLLVGSGAASREVLKVAVQRLLNLPAPPPWQDTVDAFAFALCHCLLTAPSRR